MFLIFCHLVMCGAVLISRLEHVHGFYELPLKETRYMTLNDSSKDPSSTVAVFNHTSYKDGEFKISFRCYDDTTNNDDNNSTIDSTSTTNTFYVHFSYGFSECLTINPHVKLDSDKLLNCSIKVSCNDAFQETSFDPPAYKLFPNGTASDEKCELPSADNKPSTPNKDVLVFHNSQEGSYYLKIQLKPSLDPDAKAPKVPVDNYTIEMLVELEYTHGHLMRVDYSVYKFHVTLCCLYCVIVLTDAVYLVYLRRNTNKLHSIIGISLLAGLLASFFYISTYESLNRYVSTVHENKNVMVIAAVLSSVRRIAIDATVLLVAVGYTILPIQNISLRRPLIIFSVYAVLFTSLTIFTHVSASATRLTLYTVFLLNNIFTTIIYLFFVVYVRNTAKHSCQRRSPQMEYIGIFYKRFGYVVILLVFILVVFTIPQMLELFNYSACSRVYKMTLSEVFWMLHSLVCTVVVFVTIVLHPNAQTELYGSLNFNYSQLPKEEPDDAEKFPLSSANIHIRRNNQAINDPFTLFDEADEAQEETPNQNIVRFHKIQ